MESEAQPVLNCSCGPENFVEDETEIVCRKCGTVQQTSLMHKMPDWTVHENDDKGNGREKIRAERVDEEFHTLETEVSTAAIGGHHLSEDMLDLARTQKKSHMMMTKENKTEKYLKEAYTKVNDISDKLEIPQSIVAIAKEMLRKFEKSKGLKYYRKENFVMAVLLVASKQEEGGCLSIKGISRALPGISEKEVKRFYKMLLRDTNVVNTALLKTNAQHVQQLVANYSSDLQLNFNLTQESKAIAECSIEFLEGKKPSSVAAASIWFLLHWWKIPGYKQSELAQVAGISCNTLRNVCKEIEGNIERLPAQIFYKRLIPVVDVSVHFPEADTFVSTSSISLTTGKKKVL
jgi:transcription initiation factor TFIIB